MRRSCGALLEGDGALRKFHVCAHNPCITIGCDRSKWGIYDPPEHVQPSAWRPPADDAPEAVDEPGAAVAAALLHTEEGAGAPSDVPGASPQSTSDAKAAVAAESVGAGAAEETVPRAPDGAASDTGGCAAVAASPPSGGSADGGAHADGTSVGHAAPDASHAGESPPFAGDEVDAVGMSAPTVEHGVLADGGHDPMAGEAAEPPSAWPVPAGSALSQRTVPPPLAPDASVAPAGDTAAVAAQSPEAEDELAAELPYQMVIGGELAVLDKLLGLAREILAPRSYIGHSAFLLFALSRNMRIFAWEGGSRIDLLERYAPGR